ncbi:MAG: Uma2 family endonuclease [Armatimonadetes bacterium]|nr:Uma2 family endonuclease [Armatimonadota bacterium]MCX7777901.1 Uma2 family endonuclease [Armatimonadota bacterium]
MGRRAGVVLHRESEQLNLLVGDRPLTFEEFVRRFGEDENVELIDGIVFGRNSAHLTHESLQGWLLRILGIYVSERDLGIVLGSRTAVRIDAFSGRLPDILFVRKDRMEIVKEDGIYGAPDFVIEIHSVGERKSRIVSLIADYIRVGVSEIWIIDLGRKVLRVILKGKRGYRELALRKGVLESAAVEGFWLRVDWLFMDLRPKETEVLSKLLGWRLQ